MQPFIQNNDVILIKKSCSYSLGDIVIFYNKSNLICHRIIYLKKDKVITKGDNSFAFDRVLKIDSIVGRAVLLYRQKNQNISPNFVDLSRFKKHIALISIIHNYSLKLFYFKKSKIIVNKIFQFIYKVLFDQSFIK